MVVSPATTFTVSYQVNYNLLTSLAHQVPLPPLVQVARLRRRQLR